MDRIYSKDSETKERRRLFRSKSLCTASRRHFLESCYEFAKSGGNGYLQHDSDVSDSYLSSLKSLESLHIATRGRQTATVSPHLSRRFSDGYEFRTSTLHRRHRSCSRSSPSQPRTRTDFSQSEFKSTLKNQLNQNLDSNRCLYLALKDQSNKSSASRLRRLEHLAATAEACGYETARAKAIALRTKEKRAQRCKDIKLELQDRLLKAEERRNKIHAEARSQRHLAEERRRKQREAKLASEALTTTSRGKHTKLGERRRAPIEKPVKLMSTPKDLHNVDCCSDAEVDEVTNRSMQDAIRHHSIKRKRSSSLTPFHSYASDARAVAATVVIQKKFRKHRAKLALHYFAIQKGVLDECISKGFDSLADRLSQSIVIDSATAALKSLGLQGFRDEDKQSLVNTRNFLAAYMIVSFPDCVFTTPSSDMETNVKRKADALLRAFENVSYNTPSGAKEHIDELFASYIESLNQWKDADRENLSSALLERYCNLETLKRNIAHEMAISCIDIDPIAGQQYIDGIKQNQLLILSKLRNLFGGSDIVPRVREALKIEREKGSWPSTKSPKTIRKLKRADEEESAAKKQTLRVSGLEDETQPDRVSTSLKASHEAQDAIDGALGGLKRPSSKFDAKEEVLDLSQLSTSILSGLSNRSLVHKILLDPSYHITRHDIPRNDFARSVIDSFETITSQTESKDVQIELFLNEYPILLTAVQYKLLSAVPKASSSYEQIEKYFDSSLTSFKARDVPFCSADALQFIHFLMSTMKRICSPGRDKLVREVSDMLSVGPNSALHEIIGKIIDSLPTLFEALDYLQLDYVNYFIRDAAVLISQYGLSYEEATFKDMVNTGGIQLEVTREWLTSIYLAADQKTNERDPENNGHPADAEVSLESLISHGIVDLVIGNVKSAAALAVSKITNGEPGQSMVLIPEIFDLDIEELNSIKDNLRNAILATALSLSIRNANNFSTNIISKSSVANVKIMSQESMQQKAMELFSILEKFSNCDNLIDRLHESLQESESQFGDTSLRPLVAKVLGGRDPIVGLLLRRLRLAGYKAFQLELNHEIYPTGSTLMVTGRIASQNTAKPGAIAGVPLERLGEALGLDSKLGFSPELVQIISSNISRLISIGCLQLRLHRGLFIQLLRKTISEN